MLSTASAIEFSRLASRGRTDPLIVIGERPDGSEVELVIKISACCDLRETNLVREAVGACLAADLGLPVPEAFAVRLDPDFIAAVPDPAIRNRLSTSAPIAFGSKLMAAQFSAWSPGLSMPAVMVPTAAAIFAFDAIVQNSDRRDDNPNCKVKDTELRIFDHELAFAHGLILGWRPPWEIGSLSHFETPGAHIFRRGLLRRVIDFAPIRGAWTGLTDGQIQAYVDTLPAEWNAGQPAAVSATRLIADARDKFDDCVTEIRRVLECPAS